MKPIRIVHRIVHFFRDWDKKDRKYFFISASIILSYITISYLMVLWAYS